MSKLFEHEFRIGLVAAIRTLEEVQASWETEPDEALEKARGAALVLCTRARRNGYPQIAAAASPLRDAPAAVVPKLLSRLVRVLEEVCAFGWDTKLNVLIVQGFSKIGDDLQSRLVAPNREIHVANTAAEAAHLIETHEIALIVLDIVLPDMDGRNLLSRLREDPRTEAVPVVVVSDGGGHEFKAECFALGADQYFEKSVDFDMLSVAVATTLHRSLRKQRDSTHDAQTGLLSRDRLGRKLDRMLAKAKRSQANVCLALLDFDVACLDPIPPGQLESLTAQVVAQATRAVSKVLRPDDLLARWADLEIVALFYKTTPQGATHALTRAREALSSEVFRHADATFRAEFTAGLVEVQDKTPLDDAIAEANQVLLAERAADPSNPLSENPSPARSATQTILVVDSEQEVAFRLKRKLKTFTVRHAPTERAAISAAAAGGLSIVLLDAKLSGASTFALLRRLRQTSGLERTPILMTASLGRDPDIARAFEFGADDYILKPCSTANLVARIRRHLKRAASHTSGTGLVSKAGAIAGLFSGDQLFEFVQMLGLNQKTGRLQLSSDTGTGHIDFYLGKVTGAWSSRGQHGLEATQHLLTLRSGRFEFAPTADSSGEQKAIVASVDTLLLDAMRLRDESSLQGE